MNITVNELLFLGIFSLSLGVIGSALLARKWRYAEVCGSVFAFLGLGAFLTFGLTQLALGETLSYRFDTLLPYFSVSLTIDHLSSLFLVMISVVGIFATIYGRDYMRHYADKYSLGVYYAFYNIFLLAMLLVVMADQAFFFLFAWEAMALASYFLVVFEHHDEDNVRAGNFYFVISHIATLFIFLLFIVLSSITGSFDFAVWREFSPLFDSKLLSLLALFALLGFGTKAGILPLHTWLPRAHPVAPSPVSALMSGVMIKIGIYMLIRFFFDIFSYVPVWVGITLLVLGSFSAVMGVLYALAERDLKKILAYSSIENVGIIFIGLGATLLFQLLGSDMLALFMLAGTLFHVFNHSIFKSLLFMSAGSVVLGAHTRNIEQLGGLLKRMPTTGLAFLVGAIAISGIIPFNGFVSEWIVFQSMFGGLISLSPVIKGILLFSLLALVLTSALSASCFLRAFGISFLARPRTKEAEHAKEQGKNVQFALLALVFFVLLIGLFGTFFARFFASIAQSLSLFSNSETVFRDPVAIIGYLGSLDMHKVFFGLAVSIVVTLLFARILGGKNQRVVVKTWDCGYPLTPRMEQTGTAFSRSIVTIFEKVLRPETSISRTHHTAVSTGIKDVYHVYAYDPVRRAILFVAFWVRKIQSGLTHVYLLYMMIVLLVLIIWTIK